MFMRPAKAADRMPSPFRQRSGGPRRQQRRLAARPVADRRGAQGRRRLHPRGADRLPRSAAGGLPAQRGDVLQRVLPGPPDRHAAAAVRRPRRPTPTAPQATLDQQAKDVTAFLAWASEPNLEHRKRMGISVLLFLIVLTGIALRAEAPDLVGRALRVGRSLVPQA